MVLGSLNNKPKAKSQHLIMSGHTTFAQISPLIPKAPSIQIVPTLGSLGSILEGAGDLESRL